MMKQIIIAAIVFCIPAAVHAQDKKLVREGNKLYEDKQYKEATEAYQQALMKNPNNIPGLFNLGNALYQQKNYENARKVLEATAKTAKPKETKGDANYNIGNTYMEEKKWEEAINAYKEALRNNPQDADAKYNLSYAQQMLKKEGGGGKDKNKDKNKDQNKDQQNKDQQNKDDKNKDQQNQDNKDNKDKDKDQKDQQNKDQDKEGDKDKQDQRPQSQPSKLSKEQADQLLNALQQEEKKLQDKLQKGKGIPVKVEKDW